MADRDHVGLDAELLERGDQRSVGGLADAGVDQQAAPPADQQVLRHEADAQIGLDAVDSRNDLVDCHCVLGSGLEPAVIV